MVGEKAATSRNPIGMPSETSRRFKVEFRDILADGDGVVATWILVLRVTPV